mmetsp:Transcript_84239/g.238716  ORF Transcript_84239/g.238716 Transcript_84239/m.238716 type:complete len:300 (+) Transcript_84239:1054-1953(+)
MGLAGKCSKRHSTSAESAAYGEGVLNLSQRDWLAIRCELQEVANRRDWPPVHDLPAVLLVAQRRVRAHGLVQGPGHVRVVHVELALVLDVLVPPGECQLRRHVLELGERTSMEHHGLVGNVSKGEAFSNGGGAGKCDINDPAVKADALEDLSPSVALEHRDAHLAHDLLQPADDGLPVVILALPDGLAVGLSLALVRAVPPADVRQGKVRADRGGAVADETGKMVRAPALPGVDDQGDLRPQPLHDEIVVHGPDGQERRDGERPRVSTPGRVREDHKLRAVPHGVRCLVTEVREGLLQG